ncbi:LuxR C-terminal-related transcriptional regulator [Antrihabitans sp. YC2-6]|uniref:LuxR C-terminal-related transcriptional regulator n=1 Tax=Antrihabitans sp. YC2-6 TaxID=2799498 RepID=UPI0018F6292E|nr:LuxR family transcriptional regulator [Antrihabitans sp. YC2-6]
MHNASAPLSPTRPDPKLSAREVQVMLRWITCDSKSAACSDLFITMGTVNTHLTRIREKYQAVGRPAPTKAALVARALQDGLIRLEEL